jgi:hypothetical protein
VKRSLISFAVGAFLSALSLFFLTLAYPLLLTLVGLLLVTACVVLALSLIAAIPKGLELAISRIRDSGSSKKEVMTCKYCGSALMTAVDRCPNCGAPTRIIKS